MKMVAVAPHHDHHYFQLKTSASVSRFHPDVLVSLSCYHKCYRLSGLNSKYLFIMITEPGKSMIKVPANLVPGEIPLAGLLTAAFLLCQGHLSCVSFYKATHSVHKGSSLLT